MTVKTWLNDWLILRSAELRPRTIESYRDLIDRYVIPAIGDRPAEDLPPADVRHLLASISAQGKTRTSELVFVMLKAAFKDLEPNPMLRIRRPAHIQQSPLAWSDADIARYIGAIEGHRHQLPLMLGISLGLRRGEICGIRWPDIDFKNRTIHVQNQRQRLGTGEIIDCPPKSGASIRDLPIPESIMPILVSKRQIAGYICSVSPSGIDAAHRKIVKKLDLPYTPLHGLRHSFATSCIRHGGQMKSLQVILGHADYATTANVYSHPDLLMLRDAVDCAAVL